MASRASNRSLSPAVNTLRRYCLSRVAVNLFLHGLALDLGFGVHAVLLWYNRPSGVKNPRRGHWI